MKKVAILSAVNVKHMSLISLYTDILKKENIPYDLIYMDKYGEDEYFECENKYRFENVIDHSWSKPKKALSYFKFVSYAKKIIKKNGYDFIIVWNDIAIFLFAGFLKNNFKGKYCLNVRDNLYYDKKILNNRYEKAFLSSAFNTVSSKGYLDFLPKKPEYIPIHSINTTALDGLSEHTGLKSGGEPLRIGFIGYVRFIERNKKLLEAFKNDKRFVLCYFGKMSDGLKKYAEENGIENVDFAESFPVEDTKKYLEKIDVINNLYGNDRLNQRKAISIKMYHALYAKIPILVSPDTYICDLTKELGFGIEVSDSDITKELPDRIYKEYHSLDFDKMRKNADNYLKKASEDNKELYNILIECVK